MLKTIKKNLLKSFYLLLVLLFISNACSMQQGSSTITESKQNKFSHEVYPGIDELVARNFDIIAGKKVGLITNHTGLSRDGISDIDILFKTDKCKLVALFCPEHGIRGTADEKVESGIDEKTKPPIYSLYGKTQKPTKEMLEGLDVLVFDIQDIGTRFYTYIGTMALAMQSAKENGKKFVVLDRPNTINGVKVEGAIPTPDMCGGLTCIYPIPTRHGMTIGELALLFNDHFKIGCDLEVVKMRNWDRRMYFDETGLLWVNPSPNMKTMNGAIFYPGLGALENTEISVGRGTDRPFEMYGAPGFDSEKIVKNLAKRNIPGIRFVPYSFIPTAPYHIFKDQVCYGVYAIMLDRDKLDSVLAGLHLAQAFYETHPDKYKAPHGLNMTGDKNAWDLLTKEKITPEQLIERWKPELEKFMEVRKKYLLY
jgi:uncharacterized protein YbbC (DUF1343 family)